MVSNAQQIPGVFRGRNLNAGAIVHKRRGRPNGGRRALARQRIDDDRRDGTVLNQRRREVADVDVEHALGRIPLIVNDIVRHLRNPQRENMPRIEV